MDAVEMLSFLFMLGSLTLGQDYSVHGLSDTQLQMLQDLHDFGIVYQPPQDLDRFYPTRLATTLTSSDSAGTLLDDPKSSISSQNGAGYIILETNHRLYAYTSSPLQIAVLQLFVKLTNRFPNLVSGKLTKDSVQRAIGYGITSDQIISYLSTHAHPQMLKNNPILPPTVVDQIRLWQIEGDRMKANHGFLLKQFQDKVEYQDCVRYAENLGVLVWQNDEKQMFFVTRVEQLSAFLKKRGPQTQQTTTKSSSRSAG
jgi:transcription initiation factor TFIIH subunit 4